MLMLETVAFSVRPGCTLRFMLDKTNNEFV